MSDTRMILGDCCEYVGVERIPKYFEIAERRIAEATADHPLFAAAAAGGE
jgi:hypothetical protein